MRCKYLTAQAANMKIKCHCCCWQDFHSWSPTPSEEWHLVVGFSITRTNIKSNWFLFFFFLLTWAQPFNCNLLWPTVTDCRWFWQTQHSIKVSTVHVSDAGAPNSAQQNTFDALGWDHAFQWWSFSDADSTQTPSRRSQAGLTKQFSLLELLLQEGTDLGCLLTLIVFLLGPLWPLLVQDLFLLRSLQQRKTRFIREIRSTSHFYLNI